MEAPLLTVSSVSKSFKGVHALQGIDLELAPGEIHCLAGENGSGKSTLIKVISGVHTPDSGSITIDGITWDRLTPLEAIAAGVQVIYQDFSVFPNLSVMENLALTTEVAAGRALVNWKRFRAIAERAVATIGFKVDLDAKVGDLSVADKQLVAICRALISDARMIIMDEPTTALTKNEVAALFRIILDLRARGIAILFVSHKLEEVFEIAERFTILRNGRKIITCPKEDLDRRSFAKHMTGKEFDETRFEPTALSDEPVLEVEGLSAPGAFEDVSFEQVSDPASADFVLSIATPPTADTLCSPLETASMWNCRNGDNVVLNSDRWSYGTPTFSDVDSYHIYVINHEVGHFLGHEHEFCAGPGLKSPTMAQQSRTREGGCTQNGWPTEDNQSP